MNSPLTSDEQISLITVVFSNPGEIEMVKGLGGDDAQSFVDVVDQVLHFFLLEDRLSYSGLDFVVMLSRCWIASARRSGRSV